MTDTTHALMIQVERIVRPLRATERRKLRMRRELLAHLQAAFAEESERHPDPPAALDAAIQRLGGPVDLRHSLQLTVPRLERVLLSPTPSAPWMDRWGENSNRNLGFEGMTLAPSLFAALTSTLLAYGITAVNAAWLILRYTEPLRLAVASSPAALRLAFLVCAICTLAPGLLALDIMGRVARNEPRTWKDAALALSVLALSLAWMATALLAIGQPVTWQPLAVSTAAAIAMLAGLSVLGRWMRTVPRPHSEWLRLRIDA